MCFTSLQFVNVSKDCIEMYYVNKAFNFFGNSVLEKGKYVATVIITFLCRVIKMKFYRFIATFLFLFLSFFLFFSER